MREVIYSQERWSLLRGLRARALDIMEHLEFEGFPSIIYGSVVRGDVSRTSDLDIFIPYTVSSQLLEYTVLKKMPIVKRVMTQATPYYAVKAYLYISEKDTVSFPLTPLKAEEMDFYTIAAQLTLDELRRDMRKAGINKSLQLIKPTQYGHIETPVVKNLEEAARLIGVPPHVIMSRVRVLTKRREKGRTGIYLYLELGEEHSFEETLKKMEARSPALRKRLAEGGL
ncbi:MAG: nucleotidyltransferase domain-containing protein [Nitrososphaerota archaeon]